MVKYFNILDKSSSLKTPVTKPTVSTGFKSHESRPEQETAICEVQGKNLNTSGKSNSLDKIVTEPSKFSEPKSHVNDCCKHQTTGHEVQENSLNPLDEHISSDESVTKPPVPSEQKALVISAEKETISFCKTTSVEPVTKTSESNTHKSRVSETEQQTTIHRIQGSNLIVLGSVGHKIKEKPFDALRNRSYMNRAEKNASAVRESNLITLASPGDTTLSEPAAESSECNVKRSKWDIAATNNVLTLGCNTAEVKPVSMPPELYGYGYYVGSTGYSSILPVSLTQPLASNLHYYCASSVDQQTDTQRIQEYSLITPGYTTILTESVTKPLESSVNHFCMNNAKPEANTLDVHQRSVITSDKSLKSSEHKFYMGGRKTRSRKVQRNSLLASVDPPDLASVERSNSRRQAPISRRLLVVSKFPLTAEQIFSLFDVIPGLECYETPPHLYNNHVFAVIRYRNIASAVYAKCRLHGLEYPLGNQLHVSFLESETHETNLIQEMATQVVTSQLGAVICNNNWAPQLLASSESRIPSPSLQTDAELPSWTKKAPPHFTVREKLFIVFDPHPLPQDVLDNVLSRFRNFINSHLIPGENVAYAKFAERASASHAIATLHGKTVNGVKLKVILADLPTGPQ
ncbi:hypothetical protein JD844_022924 [Phrynosoma platyrhinos]|uniref:RRM domain-containing protein n=1 Tax=Phrynosoma platyrhinos TaxID=52577 RepID=A0ABQ7SVZ4_PHRPL|nr:hypothetical protein JD844_022924 [Phrynosoma platyrhinos]